MDRRYLIAAALLIASAGPLPAQSVKAGIEAWQKSDYSGAVAIWRPLADKGDADAQFNLGQAYRLGRGVPINLSAAKTWFERAASQGHVDAETTLGLLLFQNGDLVVGLKWLKKAADQGEPRALLVYGTALVNGDSVTQDPALGYAYVSRAASQGLQPAKDTLQELDRILPADARKHGLQLAHALAKTVHGSKSSRTRLVEEPDGKIAAAKPAPGPKGSSAASDASEQIHPSSTAQSHKRATVEDQSQASLTMTAKGAQVNGGWRIQLGAFSQVSNAQALYRKVSENPAVRGLQPFYVTVGSVTRLQLGSFESKGSAEITCRKIGVSCFAVPAK